jgi:Protein of unknown function (DUF2783)
MKLDPNITDPDGLYEALVKAHEGLSDQESVALNARLVFLLANQIGEPTILYDCINQAVRSLRKGSVRGK